ncbi:853_t:CDS:2, partial [Cetraspora pellucida]
MFFLFGGVLFSFVPVDFSKIPAPTNATLTGFQTWHAEIHNFDLETWYSMLFFTAVLGIVLRGNFTSDNNILPWSFLYILLAEGTTILLNWPFDAFWFKFQGLAIDWAFIIQFTRLYIATKQNYREGYASLPQHVSDDDGRERESEEHDRPNHLHHHQKKDCHSSHVLLLPLAVFFHIAGNVLNTVFSSEGIAYGFTFTAFAFFVYLDTHLKPNKPKKPIFVPDPSTPAVVLVTTASLALSALCLRL